MKFFLFYEVRRKKQKTLKKICGLTALLRSTVTKLNV